MAISGAGSRAASRAILESWRVPYEALEFADDLSLTAVARGGRVATKGEIQGALSTGAREQLHLTARLAVLRYLGTGAEGVPLLLDDPLTGADDERFVSVMRFLASNVLAERPVLLVSCHGWRHEKLLEALPPDVSGRLARVSLAPFSSKAGGPGRAGVRERRRDRSGGLTGRLPGAGSSRRLRRFARVTRARSRGFR